LLSDFTNKSSHVKKFFSAFFYRSRTIFKMKLEPKIFRAYDIRGEAFVDFDEDGFFVIAQAFGQYIAEKFEIKRPKIFVSGDGRNSMPELWPAVIAGLEAAGTKATWGGTLPTPVNYFALHEGDFDAAIQISASHNPPADNGLKLTDRHGAVCGDEIQKIRKRAECLDCRHGENFGTCANRCEKVDFFEKYQEKIQEITPRQTARKLVVDAGNGVAGTFFPQVLRKFGHEISELFCDLDPNFPKSPTRSRT
jgi:phosphomannomutase/phosphoglucomutase